LSRRAADRGLGRSHLGESARGERGAAASLLPVDAGRDPCAGTASRTGANAEGGASTGHPRPETAGRHGRAGRLPQI